MSGRRGFLAFLGGASVTGIATTRASATAPTLILPPDLVPAAVVPVGGAYPMTTACGSEMLAFVKVAQLLPQAQFSDWLEGGLRMAQLYNGRTAAELERTQRANLARQARAQQHETPDEAHARVVRIVDRVAARWNGPGAGR